MAIQRKLEGGLSRQGKQKISLPDQPLLSVITVVFNNAKTLEGGILSVLDQTYQNVEYIIIDGGSTDGSLDIINRYENKIDYWVSEPDRGIYHAMNKGIGLAHGDWIHLLNSDDFYAHNDCLAKAAAILKNPEINFYYFTLIFEDLTGRRRKQKYPFNFLNHLKLFYSAYLPHPTLFVAKNQYEEIGVFDAQFNVAADHDLILRLCRRYRPVFVDLSMTVMRDGGHSSRDWAKTARDFRNVTIKNGLPVWIAELFFRFKLFKNRFLNAIKS